MKTDKPKKDWSKFIEAKKEIDYTTAGKELEKALYEYMEREGWDFENGKFIDFNDDEEDHFLKKSRHTHIEQDQDQTSIEDLVEQSQIEIPDPEHNAINQQNASNQTEILASAEITEQTEIHKG